MPNMPSTPTNVRDKRSDHSGPSVRGSKVCKGDKSKRIGGARSASAVDSGTKSRRPRGKPVMHSRGQSGYHKR